MIQLIFAVVSAFSWGYVPKVRTILQKTVENSGSGIYLIDQEVHFATPGEPIVLKESLWVEDDGTMKLVVTGTKEWKDQLKWVFLYQNGTRYQKGAHGVTTKKVSEDFIEKYFHYRKLESLGHVLSNFRLIANNSWLQRIGKTAKDFEYKPDPNVRLARTGGVITYALGTPSSVGDEKGEPGFWIEQDQFVVRKFRLPSMVEVSADRFSNFAHGLSFPRTRTVRWDNSQVQIQTINVRWRGAKADKFFTTSTLENSDDKMPMLPSSEVIEDFYKRFR